MACRQILLKKGDAITEGNNEELTSNVDELIHILKDKETTEVNAITNPKLRKQTS
jgi:hypothetical protein